jgi:hypothetical protein
MKPESGKPYLRCAIYTRVSTEHGLEQEFCPPRPAAGRTHVNG